MRHQAGFAGTLVILSTAALLVAAPAVEAAQPLTGQFPIEEHIAVPEPESSTCGFPISWDFSGQGTFQVFLDADGNLTGAHVVEVTSGGLSANGITLRTRSADNLHFDFTQNTVAETGLVFQYRLPGTGVVLMDRGRLVWNIDRKPVRWSDRRSSRPGHTQRCMGTSAASALP